eukprot:15454797-Alexandrium_andersonii.AAC.1
MHIHVKAHVHTKPRCSSQPEVSYALVLAGFAFNIVLPDPADARSAHPSQPAEVMPHGRGTWHRRLKNISVNLA